MRSERAAAGGGGPRSQQRPVAPVAVRVPFAQGVSHRHPEDLCETRGYRPSGEGNATPRGVIEQAYVPAPEGLLYLGWL